MPVFREKDTARGFCGEKTQRNDEKDASHTGNPVKAGYIIMICPRFLPESIPFRRPGGTFLFTENVKSTGAFTFYVKPKNRYLPETKLARDML
jgi:hypothetical protein